MNGDSNEKFSYENSLFKTIDWNAVVAIADSFSVYDPCWYWLVGIEIDISGCRFVLQREGLSDTLVLVSQG